MVYNDITAVGIPCISLYSYNQKPDSRSKTGLSSVTGLCTLTRSRHIEDSYCLGVCVYVCVCVCMYMCIYMHGCMYV